MSLAGRVDCKGIQRSTALERFVQDQIRSWAEDTLGLAHGPGYYQVELAYDPDLQKVSCSVDLTIDSARWKGFELGSGPWSALGSCLQQMVQSTPKPTHHGHERDCWRPCADETPKAL